MLKKIFPFSIKIFLVIAWSIILSDNFLVFAQTTRLKFYGEEILIQHNPVDIYRISENMYGKHFKKLNLQFLNRIKYLETIEPKKLIIKNRKYLFLIAGYENYITDSKDDCFGKNEMFLLIAEIRYSTLELTNKELLESCTKETQITKSNNTAYISWDAENLSYTIEFTKHPLKDLKDSKVENNAPITRVIARTKAGDSDNTNITDKDASVDEITEADDNKNAAPNANLLVSNSSNNQNNLPDNDTDVVENNDSNVVSPKINTINPSDGKQLVVQKDATNNSNSGDATKNTQKNANLNINSQQPTENKESPAATDNNESSRLLTTLSYDTLLERFIFEKQ